MNKKYLIIFLLLCLNFMSCKLHDNNDFGILQFSASIEKTLVNKATHQYHVILELNDVLEVNINDNNNNIHLTILAPDNSNLLDINDVEQYDSVDTLKNVLLWAKKPGVYTVKVSSKLSIDSTYKIFINKQSLNPEQKAAIEAQKNLLEANKLRAQGTTESVSAAIQKYKLAIDYFNKTSNIDKQAHALQGLVGAYVDLGDAKLVGVYQKQLIRLWEELGNKSGEGAALSRIGVLFYNSGDIQKALGYFQQALALKQQANDLSGIQDLLSNTGSACWYLDDNQQALELYNQALIISKQVGSVSVESNLYHNMGSVYDDLGDYEKAIEYYSKSLFIEENKINKAVRSSGDSLYMLGRAYNNLGDKEKAIELYNRALPLIQASGNKKNEGFILQNLAAIYRKDGDREKSLVTYNKALELATSINDRSCQALIFAGLGNLYFSLGEYDKALENYTKSGSLSQQIGDLETKSPALLGIARVWRVRGDLNKARQAIDEVIKNIESLRKKIDSPKIRSLYLARRRDYYDAYVDLLMAAKSPERALEMCEQGRGRTLLESLGESEKTIRQGVDFKLLDREKGLSSQLNLKLQSQVDLLSRDHTSAEAENLRVEIEALQEKLQFVEIDIRKRNPQYAALKYPSPITIKNLQHNILDNKTSVVEYLLGQDSSYVWVVNSDSLYSYQLPNRDKINELCRNLYNNLISRSKIKPSETDENKRQRIDLSDRQYSKISGELSDIILKPILSNMKEKVIIVADEGLYYVPFAALPVSGKPLIFEHEVVNVPSASVLQVLRQRKTAIEAKDQSIAIFADPVFNKSDERVTHSNNADVNPNIQGQLANLRGLEEQFLSNNGTLRGNGLPRLVFTRTEAEQIAAIFGSEKASLELDFDASLQMLKSQKLTHYGILHFATHGFINTSHPELSGLVLSTLGKDGSSQIGVLTATDVLNLNLSANLVVLSACSTALGKEIRGEGLVGLTQAFFYAGAQQIIVSLWSVNDEGTSLLMTTFYKAMISGGKSPSEALRQAQIELATRPETANPYFWAAFTLQGDFK